MQWGLIAVASVLTGCLTVEFGPAGGSGGNPTTGGEGGVGLTAGGGNEGGSGGAPPADCPGTNETCAVVPADFTGPYLVTLSDEEAGCNDPAWIGGFAEDGFTAPDAICQCGCFPPGNACQSLSVNAYAGAGCETGVQETFTLDVGGCQPLEAENLGFTVSIVDGTGVGQCFSNDAPPIQTPIVFNVPVTGCDAELQACGDGGVCLPPDESVRCVRSETADECPLGFPNPRPELLVEKNIEDTRDCSCDCGAVEGTCDEVYRLFSDSTCETFVVQYSDTACHTGADIASVQYRPAVSCPTSFQVTGGASATSGLLLCCDKP